MGAGVAWNMGVAGSPPVTPVHASVADLHHQRPVPEHPLSVDPGLSTAGCSNHASPNFQPSSVATLAGGQFRPIRPPNDGFFDRGHFHWRCPAGPAAAQLDGRMDGVSAELK